MVSVLSPDETLNTFQKAPQPPAITISGVSVSYPVGKKHRKTILEDLNLKIDEGEFVVLLGETGCGKSTLLRMILGQEQPTTGGITVAGSRVERVDARSGYVPQKYSLFPDRTVLDNLTMGPETSRYHILGRLKPGFRAFRRQVREEAMKQLQHMGLQPTDAAKYAGDHNTFAKFRRCGNSWRSTRAVRPLNARTTAAGASVGPTRTNRCT